MLRLHAECEAWGLTSYSAYKEASLRLDQHLHEEYSPFHLLLQHASPPLPLVRAPSFSSLRSADADSHSVVHYSPPSTAHDSEDIIKLVKASTDNPMMQLFLEMIE